MAAQINAQGRVRKLKRDFANVAIFAYTDINKLSVSQIPTDHQLDDKLVGTLVYGAVKSLYIRRSLSVFEWCFDRNGNILKNREPCGRPFVDHMNRAIMIDGIVMGGAARVPAGQYNLNNIWNIGVFQLAAWEQSLPIIDFNGPFPVCLSRWVGKKGDQNRPNHQGSAAAAVSNTNSVNTGIPVPTAAAAAAAATAAAQPAQLVSQSTAGMTGRQSDGNLLGVAPEAPAAIDPGFEEGIFVDDGNNNNEAQVDLANPGLAFESIANDVVRGLDIANVTSGYIMDLLDSTNGSEQSMEALTFYVDELHRQTAELRGHLNNWQHYIADQGEEDGDNY